MFHFVITIFISDGSDKYHVHSKCTVYLPNELRTFTCYLSVAFLFVYTISTCWDSFLVWMSSEKELLESLPLGKQCTEEEQVLLHFLFENKLKKVRGLFKDYDKYFKCRLLLKRSSCQILLQRLVKKGLVFYLLSFMI